MDNQKLLNDTVKELATRLGNVEIERASFRAQAIQALQENESLKKQVEDLNNQIADLNNQIADLKKKSNSKADLPKEDKSDDTSNLPQGPQPGM